MNPPPTPSRFAVLSVGISAVSLADTLRIIDEWIQVRTPRYVNVCTSDTVLRCYDQPDLAAVVRGAGLAVPDGMPLVWIGRGRGFPVTRVYGPDLMLALCRAGVSRGYRHFFYGATPPVLERLVAALQARYPGLQVAGSFAPPFRDLTPDEEETVVRTIDENKPDIVWVGLGTPRQDFWVARLRPRLQAPVLIPVGAAFNFHSGFLQQAPRWMMRCGLEWLFRLCMEPRRLWKRYLLGNPRFVALVLRQLLLGKPDPCIVVANTSPPVPPGAP